MLKQKFILSYGSKIFVQLLTIATTIVVARIVGPTVLGTVAWAMAYVQMFSFVADLGLGTAHIRKLSSGEDEAKCNATFAVLKAWTISFFIAAFAGFFLFQKYILNYEFESAAHEYVLFITLGVLVLQEIQAIPSTTFAGKIEQAKQDLPYMIRGILFQIFRIVIVLLGGKAIALVFGNLAAVLIVTPIYFILFKKYPFGKYDKKLAKEYIKIAAPIFVLGAATTLTNAIDKVLLEVFVNTEAVGYYTAGFRLGGFILVISRSMSMLFFPMFTQAVQRKDFGFIKEKIEKFEKFSFLFIMPGVILVALYSHDIVLLLLGEDYLPSVGIMPIVTLALFLTVFNTPYGNLINGFGRFTLTAIIAVVNFVIYVGVIYVMANEKMLNLGGEGVAWSLLITNVLLAFTYRYFSMQDAKNLSNILAIKFLLFGVITFFVADYFFVNYFSSSLWWRLSFLPLYIIPNYVLLHLLGWMTKNDWIAIAEMFNLKTMVNYIKGEFKKK